MALQFEVLGNVHRALGSTVPDDIDAEARMSRYGEFITENVIPTKHVVADEGSYFVALTTNGGTGIILGSATTFTLDTNASLYIKNNASNSDSSAKRIYIDYIRQIVTAISTAGTTVQFAIKIDKNDLRYTSGGTQLFPVSPNLDSSITSNALIYAGALLTGASSNNARLVARGVISSTATVINDEYIIKSGGVDNSDSTITGGTVARRVCVPVAPIILGPGQCMTLNQWYMAGTSAPVVELEIGYWER